MIVRSAAPDDAAALADVACRAITITGASAYDADQIVVWSSSFSPAALRQVVDSTSVFVVDDSGEIAGFSNLRIRESERAELDLLYVDPGFAGRGVARQAVAAVEAEATRRGITRLWADASLLAAPVFEHLGFTVVERYDKVRGAVSFPNTWLAKELR
ncbi:MAG: GNAT family N-acetyltransferase [Acidimicrobiia bacterium]